MSGRRLISRIVASALGVALPLVRTQQAAAQGGGLEFLGRILAPNPEPDVAAEIRAALRAEGEARRAAAGTRADDLRAAGAEREAELAGAGAARGEELRAAGTERADELRASATAKEAELRAAGPDPEPDGMFDFES